MRFYSMREKTRGINSQGKILNLNIFAMPYLTTMFRCVAAPQVNKAYSNGMYLLFE